MVRVRSLVLAVAAATALTSEIATAVGLGPIELSSSLNQPLVAEIDLLDASKLSAAELRPALASDEAFNQAGLERPFFLSDLKFQVVTRQGRKVIRVSSRKPVREPYLNFLVEMAWPNGRLLREYTLLLDPPVYSPHAKVKSAAGVGTTHRPQSQPSAHSSRDLGTYRTRKNDTLWDIALAHRQGGTVHQSMLAIQALNPQAFIRGNINLLRAGQVLQLPSRAQIRQHSHAEAIAAIEAQTRQWKATQQVAEPTAEETPPSNRQLMTQPEPVVEDLPQPVAEDSLRLATLGNGEGTEGQNTAAPDVHLEDQLVSAQESLESSQREGAALKERLEDLQGQLQTLQSLMSLQEVQLAQLQAQLGQSTEHIDGAAESSETMPTPEITEIEAVTNDQVTGLDKTPQLAENTMEETAVVVSEAGNTASSSGVVPDDKAALKVKDKQQVVAAARPVSPPPAEEDLLSMNINDPLLLGAGGGILLLLVVLLIYLKRRKQAQQSRELEESRPSTAPLQSAPTPVKVAESEAVDVLAEAAVYISYGRFEQAEQLLQSELTEHPERQDLRLKLLEVKAGLGDADGFAAEEARLRGYGMAEAPIAAVKSKYPAIVGLLAGGAASAVDSAPIMAPEIETTLEPKSEAKPKVEQPATEVKPSDSEGELGLGLDLNDFFVESQNTPSQPTTLNKQPESPRSEDASAPSAPVTEAGDFAGFDLDLSKEEPTQASPSSPSGFQPVEEISLDLADLERSDTARNELDSLGVELEQKRPTEPSKSEHVAESSAPVDEAGDFAGFDLDLSKEKSTQASPSASPSGFQPVEEISLDLADLEKSDTATNHNELDSLGALELDQNQPTEPSKQVAATDSLVVDDLDLGSDADFAFLNGIDEVSTKLDLAKAYLEINDTRGARDLLDEVLQEGNAEQQRSAQEMLTTLG